MMKLPQCSVTAKHSSPALLRSAADLATARMCALGKVTCPVAQKEQHQPERGLIATLTHRSEHEVSNSVLLPRKTVVPQKGSANRLKGTCKPMGLSPPRITLLPVNCYLLLQRPPNGLVSEIRF